MVKVAILKEYSPMKIIVIDITLSPDLRILKTSILLLRRKIEENQNQFILKAFI